ncbi:hypothetical protein CF131_15665 [Aeromonas dhakensis]|nr:hypothetical protein CF131_15665 [Aeromonas dhakensis]TNI47035.1 hypothetical protein CF130_04490 [Aeromonas dhakensis]
MPLSFNQNNDIGLGGFISTLQEERKLAVYGARYLLLVWLNSSEAIYRMVNYKSANGFETVQILIRHPAFERFWDSDFVVFNVLKLNKNFFYLGL